MKTLRFLLVLFAAAMTFWSCEKEPLETTIQENDLTLATQDLHKSKLQNKVFTSEALETNLFGNTPIRKMQIYTPPGYDKHGSVEYPVVYLLHGLPFSEKFLTDIRTWDEWIDPDGIFREYPDFPEEGFREWVDGLITSGAMEPMIIVMPNADSEAGYRFSFYTNSILNGNFEDYIVNDLVNYMDTHYKTIPDASGRAVIGYSQGGYAAFKFGMKHPDVFGAVASHSGLLLVDAMFEYGPVLIEENPEGFNGPDPEKFLTSAAYAMSAAWSPNPYNPPFYVDFPFEWPSPLVLPDVAERWYTEDVFHLIDTHVSELNALQGIYFDIGNYDELGMNVAYPYVVQKLNYYGINYHYETYDGGHLNKSFERLAESLAFCSDALK